MVDPFSERFAAYLGEEIFTRRKLSGLSAKTVASNLGTTRKTLASIEAGSRTPDLRLAIKAYLELGGSLCCLADYLIGEMYGMPLPETVLKQSSDRDAARAKELHQS